MKEKDLKVSVVIPNWNGRELMRKNLPSVFKAAKLKSNRIVEVIVVDDGSTDDSVEFVRKNFKEARLIVHKKNRGFSSAVNMGVRHAKGDLVCLLNTDVSVNTSFLRKVIGNFLDKQVFGVSLHEAGYGPAGAKFVNGYLSFFPRKESKKVQNTFWVSGGSGVFRRAMWMEMKGLDEGLLSPFYWEDLDISYRAMKRGYKLLWEPSAHVVHKHEASINSNNFNLKRLGIIKERNELLFIWKNISSDRLIRKHLRGVIVRAISHPGYLRVIYSALKQLKLVKKGRAREKLEAKVSDEAIFERFL